MSYLGAETKAAVENALPKIRTVLQWVGSGRLVLDMGCNDGALAREIQILGNRIIGCDFPEFALLTRLNYELDTVACDLTRPLPFASERLDVIIATGIMEFIPNDRAFISECHRLLKRGGKLVLTVLNVASLANRLLLLRGKGIDCYPDNRLVLHRYTVEHAKTLLRGGGFEILEQRKCPGRYQGWARIYSWFEYVLPATFSTELALLGRKI